MNFLSPELGGIRIGLPTMTTQGFGEKEFVSAHEGVQITLETKKLSSGSKPQDFMKFVPSPDFISIDRVSNLRKRVEALTVGFPLPGL